MAVINKLNINQFRNLTNQYLEPGKNITLLLQIMHKVKLILLRLYIT